MWRESAIEANHQEWRTALAGLLPVGVFDLLQLLSCECQWFFNKHVLSGIKRLTYEFRMTVMPRRYDNRVDIGVGNNPVAVGRGLRDPKLFCGMDTADSRGRSNRLEHSGCLAECRN